MAIRVIEGVPGSGKTFYAVKHVLEDHFRWDVNRDEFTPKDNVRVFTNISGFKLGESLDQAITSAGGLEKFFSLTFQKTFARDKKLVYIIDEAQGYFHRKFFNKEVMLFFQWHRHLGCTIYLLTQDVKSLAVELRQLAEYYVVATRRSLSLVGEFRYQFKSGEGDQTPWARKTMKPDSRIFSLYQSMVADSSEKTPSAIRRIGFYFVLTIVVLVVGGWFAFSNLYGGRSSASAATRGSKPAPTTSVHSEKLGPPSPSPVVNSVHSDTVPPAPGPGPSLVGLQLAAVYGTEESATVVWRLPDGAEFRQDHHSAMLLCRCNVLTVRPYRTFMVPSGMVPSAAAGARPRAHAGAAANVAVPTRVTTGPGG